MALTNYWWLLIWLFLGGAILNNFPKRMECLDGKFVEHWDILPAVLMVIPYIIWAGFRSDVFGDTYMYRRSYLGSSSDWSQIPSILFGDGKDPGFSALQVLVKPFLGNQDVLFFLLIAAFQLISIALVFRKYSKDYWTCIFLFVVSTDYLSWMHNGIRQFVAVSIIFLGFRLFVTKKYIPLIALIFFASLIHGSALLMLPVIFIVQGKAWNIRTVLMLVATMVIVIYIEQFTPILSDMLSDTQYEGMTTDEIWTADDGTNILRVLVYSAPALLSLLGLRYVRAANDPIINICVNCSIFTMALYAISAVTSGIYIGRLPIYTTLQGYITVPWLIEHMFTKSSAKLVSIVVFALYLAFFYFQMHLGWGVF